MTNDIFLYGVPSDPNPNDVRLRDPAAITGFTGSAALTVLVPAIAAVGTEQDFLAGSGVLDIPQPIIAAMGLLQFTGIAALPVTPTIVAASGLVTISITGTAALTVPVPAISAIGTVPSTIVPAGVPSRRTIRRFQVPQRIHGTLAMAIPSPHFHALGAVVQPWEAELELTALLAFEDDPELLLTVVDAWMN